MPSDRTAQRSAFAVARHGIRGETSNPPSHSGEFGDTGPAVGTDHRRTIFGRERGFVEGEVEPEMPSVDAGVGVTKPSLWRRADSLLRAMFSRRRRQPADPTTEILPHLDVDSLLAELGIAEKAAINGRHDIPASTDTHFDDGELLIVQRIERVIREAKSQLSTHLANLNSRIRSTDVSQDCAAVRALPAALNHDLTSILRYYGERVGPLRDRRRALRQELVDFRHRHGIRREPRIPTSQVLHVGILLLMFVIELVANGIYLAPASDLYLVGGMATAAAIALVNVMSSWTLGRMASWLVGARRGLRIPGALAALGFLCFAAFLNLTVAHARDLADATRDLNELIRPAIAELRANPLGLRKLDSWLLLVVGGSFAIIAFLEGTRWDDPTLGYSKHQQRLEEASDDYLHERRSLDEEGIATLSRHSKSLHDQSDRVRYRIEALRSDIARKGMLGEKSDNFLRFAVQTCNAMLGSYRALNRQHRKTPAPSHFQSGWQHPDPELVAVDLSDDLATLADQESGWKELASEVQSIQRTLESQYTTFLTRSGALSDDDDDAVDQAAAEVVDRG